MVYFIKVNLTCPSKNLFQLKKITKGFLTIFNPCFYQGVCWAVCEELLRGEAFVFLATHFQLIPQLARLYPTVSNYHFLSSVDGQEESFAHMLGKYLKYCISYFSHRIINSFRGYIRRKLDIIRC